jgi:hypothetical protein
LKQRRELDSASSDDGRNMTGREPRETGRTKMVAKVKPQQEMTLDLIGGEEQ